MYLLTTYSVLAGEDSQHQILGENIDVTIINLSPSRIEETEQLLKDMADNGSANAMYVYASLISHINSEESAKYMMQAAAWGEFEAIKEIIIGDTLRYKRILPYMEHIIRSAQETTDDLFFLVYEDFLRRFKNKMSRIWNMGYVPINLPE